MSRPRPAVVLGAVAAAGAIAAPLVMTSSYAMGLLHLALVYALLTSGFNFTQGLSGRTSLGHVGFWAIGAYATALLTGLRGWPPLLSMAVGVGVAMLVALILAALTNALQAFYLALATLGFGQIVQIIAVNWTDVTRGSGGVPGIPAVGVGIIDFDTPTRQYYLLLTLVVLGALFTRRFVATKVGREAFAMRQSEVAAESLGIRTRRIKSVTLIISAVYAAVAGSMYAHVYGYISPDVFSFTTMLLILAMLVVGGQGTVWGPVVGAVVVALLPEGLRVSDRYWLLLYGVGLFVVMLKMPGGIAGLTNQLLGRARREPGADPEAQIVGERQENPEEEAAAP
jgi:branched-chain amino acid transport system permease protein